MEDIQEFQNKTTKIEVSLLNGIYGESTRYLLTINLN